MKTCWRGPLLALGALCALAALGEVTLRLTGDRARAVSEGLERLNPRWATMLRGRVLEGVDDPVRLYAPRPGADVEVTGLRFRIESHRVRGSEVPADVPDTERRLVVVGDSFAFGLWCAEDETLAAHLARLATAEEERRGSGLTWRGITIAAPGYNTLQQVRAFEQDAPTLEPDLVVLYFNPNDLPPDGFLLDPASATTRLDTSPLPTSWKRALWHSHLYGFLVRHAERAKRAREAAKSDGGPVPPAYRDAGNRALAEEAVERLADACRALGAPLCVLNQTHLANPERARDPDWPWLEVTAWMRGVAERQGLPTVDTVGWVRGWSDGVDRPPPYPPPDFQPWTYFSDLNVQAFLSGELTTLDPAAPVDTHLIGEGYEALARIVFAELIESGLLRN